MSSHPRINGSPSFAGFLEYLRASGFSVEVSHYARVQKLLERLGDSREPEDLKSLLCPLFANSGEEQRRFYELFDEYLIQEETRLRRPRFETDDRELGTAVEHASRRVWSGHALLLVLLAAICFLLLYHYESSPDSPGPEGAASPLATLTPTLTQTPGDTPLPSPTISPSPSGTPDASPPPTTPSKDVAGQRPPPLAYLSILLAGLLLFSAQELLLRRRRRQLFKRQHDKRPPSSWPLRTEGPALKLYGSDNFYKAARLLRRRQEDLFQRFHLPDTIAATIRALGYPSLRYKPDTKAPEYLILIERAAPDDHQAALFDELFKALRREGVFAVRYFYEGDLRLCYDDERGERRRLTELRSRYGGHRLLIFGSGEKLLSPLEGKLAPWCALFAGWSERALLTPTSPLGWGHREARLAELLTLLPATSSCLRALASRLASHAALRTGDLARVGPVLPPTPQLKDLNQFTTLRAYLGEQTFQWLCACSLHGRLRWELTLRLGLLPSLGPEPLVTEENLLRLVRLSWFRRGRLPEDLRLQFCEALDPQVEEEARALLADELKREGPPPGAFAAATRNLELAAHKWLLSAEPDDVRHLEMALADVPTGDVLQDRVLTEYLRQMPAPRLFGWLPHSFFRNNISAYGLKSSARLLAVLCLTALGLLVLREVYSYAGMPKTKPPIISCFDTRLGVKPACDSVNSEDLLRHIKTLSSDEYEGRGPGTKGEELSVKYITEQFQRLGLKPGNPDGTFVQKVPLAGFRSQPEVTLKAGAKEMKLENLKDYVAVSRRYEEQVNVDDSDLVFVGYGVDAPEYGWDDYKGLDVKGKTIVMLVNDPAVPLASDPSKLDPNVFKGDAMTYYGRWTYKYEIASKKGAAAAIIVHEEGPAGYPFEVVSGSWGRENFDIVSADKNASRVGVESWITLDKAKELFAAAGQDFDALHKAAATKEFKPVPLNAKAKMHVRNTLRTIDSQNVVAKLEGSDPSLKNEYVVYTAHWDHLGRDDAAQGDGIFNGAIDNASGVGSVLEIAEAFTKLPSPPKRSVLFMAVTGEEKGLLGAKYYAEHPLYPLAKTLADINIDGVNQWGRTSDITLIGLGNSTLDDIAEAAAQAQGGRTLTPDPEPGKGFYYRSDHFEFAKRGVPALDPDAGVKFVGKEPDFAKKKRDEYEANDYHKPSDEVKPDWDLSGAVEDAQLLFVIGYNVLQGDKYPEWKPSEFKTLREEALKVSGGAGL